MSDQSPKTTGDSHCSRKSCCILPWVLIYAIVAVIGYRVFLTHPEANRRLWLPIVVETNNTQGILGETRQMEFWTPSAKTKFYLGKTDGQFNAKEKWQVLDTDDIVTKFGNTLHSNKSVFGYRRVEVWGQGRTGFKPGWWWTMNVAKDFAVGDLAQSYHDFWKSSQPVLVEVIDNRGSSDK